MRKTTNYELNIAEGSDRYNHLTIDNPNYEKIDITMKANEDSAVQTATELKSGTVHAITRNKQNASMFRFVATSDYTSGETFTVDGQQVTALLPNGATLGTGAYHINANVLCCLVGTNMTVYTVGAAENIDATTLDGHSADYFASASALSAVSSTAESAGIVANAASTKTEQLKLKIDSLFRVHKVENPTNNFIPYNFDFSAHKYGIIYSIHEHGTNKTFNPTFTFIEDGMSFSPYDYSTAGGSFCTYTISSTGISKSNAGEVWGPRAIEYIVIIN